MNERHVHRVPTAHWPRSSVSSVFRECTLRCTVRGSRYKREIELLADCASRGALLQQPASVLGLSPHAVLAPRWRGGPECPNQDQRRRPGLLRVLSADMKRFPGLLVLLACAVDAQECPECPGQSCSKDSQCAYDGCGRTSDRNLWPAAGGHLCDIYDGDGPGGVDKGTYRCIGRDSEPQCSGQPNGHSVAGGWCWDSLRDYFCDERTDRLAAYVRHENQYCRPNGDPDTLPNIFSQHWPTQQSHTAARDPSACAAACDADERCVAFDINPTTPGGCCGCWLLGDTRPVKPAGPWPGGSCYVRADRHPEDVVEDSYGLVFNSNPLSWADAEAHCVSLGGHLATIKSEEMARHIDSTYVRGGGQCHATWIGYNDRASEGAWVWADGSTSSYTNWWKPSEPNDMDTGEDCATLGVDCLYGFGGVGNYWADSGCAPGDYEYTARASLCQISEECEDEYSSGHFLFEDKGRGAGCEALDNSGAVVGANDQDHCCQDEEYCCPECGAGSDSCGYRFRCATSGGERRRLATGPCDDTSTNTWAVGLTFMGFHDAACSHASADPGDGNEYCQCKDLDGNQLCNTAYRQRSNGYYARCELIDGSCRTINREMAGGTFDEDGKLSFACATSGGATFTFHAERKSWHAARDDCRALGGDLASIHSAAENDEAYALAGGRDVWLGLNGEEREDVWVWSDGSPMDHDGWAPSEPNNYGGDEDCGGYWSGRAEHSPEKPKGWDSLGGRASCNAEQAYICRNTKPKGGRSCKVKASAVKADEMSAGAIAGIGLVLALFAVGGSLCLTRLSKRNLGGPPVQAQRAPTSTATPYPESVQMQGTVAQHVVATVVPVATAAYPSASEVQATPAYPYPMGMAVAGSSTSMSLSEMVEIFKREIGLDGTMQSVVQGAAQQLGVAHEGQPLMQTAQRCLQKLGHAA